MVSKMTEDLTLNMDAYLPLRDVVFNTLREAILKGELKPGERLMELQLAAKLGVSRTPIREAIRMLEQEGLAVTIWNMSFRSVKRWTSLQLKSHANRFLRSS